MLVFIARRLLATIPVLIMVAVVVFAILRASPGDPAIIMAGDAATPERIAQIRQVMGLDQPLVKQFFIWTGRLVRGDMGTSLMSGVPVTQLIGQRLEPSLSLAMITLVFTLAVAIPLGILAAWRRGRLLDRAVMGFSVLGFSVPVFVTSYVLIWAFAIKLGWFNVQGYTPLAQGFWPYLHRLVLPSLALSTVYVALIARITRTSIIEVMGEDFIRTARQGAGRNRRAAGPRPAQCRGAHRHGDRGGRGAADQRRGGDGVGVQHSRPGPPGRRGRDGARLPRDPGADAVLRVRLRVHQSGGRLRLYGVRPAHQVLTMPTHSDAVADGALPENGPPQAGAWRRVRREFSGAPVLAALAVLALVVGAALLAPWLGTVDPTAIDPGARLKPPFGDYLFGTDAFGRDIWSRVVYGARVSLVAGLGAALVSVTLGLVIGVIAGWFRTLDGLIIRTMDAVMAIPGILLAIALVSVTGASLATVLVAITIPEIPRVVRLVRGQILSVRGEPYVEAALALGTPLPLLLWRHLVPSTVAPLTVQGTYVFASAMLTEAILSFLGAGIPPEIASWGNIMSEGRMYFRMLPGLILFPGLFLSLTVLSVNILGDALDPKMTRRT